jgi:hypothetical protein
MVYPWAKPRRLMCNMWVALPGMGWVARASRKSEKLTGAPDNFTRIGRRDLESIFIEFDTSSGLADKINCVNFRVDRLKSFVWQGKKWTFPILGLLTTLRCIAMHAAKGVIECVLIRQPYGFRGELVYDV